MAKVIVFDSEAPRPAYLAHYAVRTGAAMVSMEVASRRRTAMLQTRRTLNELGQFDNFAKPRIAGHPEVEALLKEHGDPYKAALAVSAQAAEFWRQQLEWRVEAAQADPVLADVLKDIDFDLDRRFAGRVGATLAQFEHDPEMVADPAVLAGALREIVANPEYLSMPTISDGDGLV